MKVKSLSRVQLLAVPFSCFSACLVSFDWMLDIIQFTLLDAVHFWFSILIFLSFVQFQVLLFSVLGKMRGALTWGYLPHY